MLRFFLHGNQCGQQENIPGSIELLSRQTSLLLKEPHVIKEIETPILSEQKIVKVEKLPLTESSSLLLRHKRKKTEFSHNYSAALSLPLSNRDLEELKNDPKELLKRSASSIIEHARRRVDLMAYTLIAYSETECAPKQGHTALQHGKGRSTSEHKNITQACHSSFFPSFIDNKIKNKRHSKLSSRDLKWSMLNNTHFMHSLNATVELPAFVNKFDEELEGKAACREKTLEIISQVAELRSLSPIEGLNAFLQIMEKTFENLIKIKSSKKEITYLTEDSAELPICIRRELLELVKEGTLGRKWDSKSKSVSNEYIELLLRLKPKEIAECRVSSKNRNRIYKMKMLAIQKEILTPQSELEYASPSHLNKVREV